MIKKINIDFSNIPDIKSLDEFEKIELLNAVFEEAKLTENEKIVYKMRRERDFSFNIIAKILNLSQFAVHSHYRRAEEKIKKFKKNIGIL